MRRIILLLILLLACIFQANGSNEIEKCGCIGCCKPAPPVCCDPACPKCLIPARKDLDGLTKPKYPEFIGLPPGCDAPFPLYISDTDSATATVPTLPTNCPIRYGYPPFVNFHANQQGNDNEQIYLKERAFERAYRYPIPDESCRGPNCPCASCVCCFTETIQCRSTTTCTLTSMATRILTEYDEVLTVLPTLTSVTSIITFTVVNETIEKIDSVVATSTESFTATDTVVSVIVTTSTINIYLSTLTVTAPPTTIPTAIPYFFTLSSTAFATVGTLGRTVFGVATAYTSLPYYTGVSYNSVTVVRRITSVDSLQTQRYSAATPVTVTTRVRTYTPEVIPGTAVVTVVVRTDSFTSSITVPVLDVLRTRTLRTTTIDVRFTSTRPSPTISITCTDTLTVTTTPIIE